MRSALAGGAAPNTIGTPVFYESLYSGAGSLSNTGTVTFDTGDHPIAAGGPVTTIRPDSTSSTGNWRNDTGGTDLHTPLSETGSPIGSSYIISGVNPVADTCKVGLSNFVSHTPTGEVVRYEYYKQQSGGTGTVNLRVRVLEGSTERASWTHNDISTTSTIAQQSLSSVEFSAISDRDNQFLEFTANP
jgi:hypothetical protein